MGVANRKTKVSGYHTGQHSMMPVRHVPYSSIASSESRVQGTVNAPVCVNVKVHVLTTTIPAYRSDRLDSATLVFMFINQTFMLQFSAFIYDHTINMHADITKLNISGGHFGFCQYGGHDDLPLWCHQKMCLVCSCLHLYQISCL